MNELRAILDRIISARGVSPGVLATLVTVEGSSYRRPGARLLLTPEGVRVGSISGGCLEEDVQARSRRVAETGVAELATYDTTAENDLVWGVGLGCHGVVRILIERLPAEPVWVRALAANRAAHRPTALVVVWRSAFPENLGTRLEGTSPALADEAVFRESVAPPVHLAIFGAGDDAQPLARMADELGWRVTVADPRADFATQVRFPTATARVVATADQLVARAALPADALAVVMTHRYVHDVPVLHALLARPPAYIGLLGPKQRADRILADLSDGGFAVGAEARARLHAPVGLDLGGSTPEAVALSIIAEMQAFLAGRDARPLRERRAPIHG